VVISGTPTSSTNKTDCHDITEILLKVALNTITIQSYTSQLNILTKRTTALGVYSVLMHKDLVDSLLIGQFNI
jgi:hypothetical protein